MTLLAQYVCWRAWVWVTGTGYAVNMPAQVGPKSEF